MSQVLTPAAPTRNNNFNILRFGAAICVMAGHMGYIANSGVPKFLDIPINSIGVSVLFLLSGYLISQSWRSDPHPLRYLLKRFVRLWPAFAVCVLLMVYVAGPLLSTLGREGYFQSWYTAYLSNLRFQIVFALPGVFAEELPYLNTVNGSFWTLPVEALTYILCPLLIVVCNLPKNPKAKKGCMLGITAAAFLFEAWLYITTPTMVAPSPGWIIYSTDWAAAWYLIVYFLMGMLYAAIPEIKRYLNIQWAIVLMIFMSCTHFDTPMQTLAVTLTLPYFIFSFALIDKPLFPRFGAKYDITYGIYLYGFFFQQLAAWIINVRMHQYFTYMMLFAVSLVPTLIAAWLSHMLIERPLSRLLQWLFKRSRENRQEHKHA